MKCKYLALTAVIAVPLFLSGKATAANTTTKYDNVIRSIDKLEVTDQNGTMDITYNWEGIFVNVASHSKEPQAQEMLKQFKKNKPTGYGYLVQAYRGGMRLTTFEPDATVWFDRSYTYAEETPLTFSKGRACSWTALGGNWLSWSNLDENVLGNLIYYSGVVCWNYNDYVWGVSNFDPSMPFLFIASRNLEYPKGYAGYRVKTQSPKAIYVAMGDSFSSGEGNPTFEAGTDAGDNKCHRSSDAYARLLGKDPALNLGTTAFVACSGATTENIVRGQYNEKAQTNALSKDTKVVTITIGGNDVGFGDFATACTTGPCDYSTKAYSEIRRKINYELPEKLTRVFSAIDSKTSVATKVYVIGYPHIAPSKMPTSACWPLNGGFDRKDPATGDGAAVRNVVNELNQMIQKKVESYKSTKFSFVNVNKSGSPFEGHDWCKTDRYFQLIAVNSVPYSFHPNIKGHEAYRDIVKGAMLAK